VFDELRAFLAAHREGTFTAGARQVHLSQPAFTAAIHRLETQVGGRLFDRGPGGARLTAAGHALLPWAQQALSSVDRGIRAVADVEGLRSGEVRVAAGSTACAVLLPPYLTDFHRTHPGVRMFLREALEHEIREGVGRGELDLGIVAGQGTERWLDDDLVLVAAPDVDARGLPHLTFPVGANHRALLDRHFPEADIAMELSSLAAVRAHVETGLGVALLSHASVARALASGRLRLVEDPRTPLRRTLSLLHLGVERMSPAAAALRTRLLG
jgi:DNA-binding transcriptional LysR family regulator